MNRSESELSRELKAKQREIHLLRRRLRAASSSPAPKTTNQAPSPQPTQDPEQDLPPIESLSYDAASKSWKLRPES